MSEDKFVVQDSCGDGYALEFAYGIVDLIDKNDNGHVVTEFYEDDFPHTGKWISVKDRLPENEQEVLVISHGWGGRLLYIGTYKRIESKTSWLTGITSKASDWSLWGWSYLREPHVTHWMPLPELPEEVAQ